jgi:hypothetical protein
VDRSYYVIGRKKGPGLGSAPCGWCFGLESAKPVIRVPHTWWPACGVESKQGSRFLEPRGLGAVADKNRICLVLFDVKNRMFARAHARGPNMNSLAQVAHCCSGLPWRCCEGAHPDGDIAADRDGGAAAAHRNGAEGDARFGRRRGG